MCNNNNFLSDTMSLRSVNSSATFNMTSVSQQPTVVPAIDVILLYKYTCNKIFLLKILAGSN